MNRINSNSVTCITYTQWIPVDPHNMHTTCAQQAEVEVPVGADGGVVGYLVVVHSPLALLDEADPPVIGSDAGGSSDGFLEVGVDGGACDRLQPLELARCRHIDPL